MTRTFGDYLRQQGSKEPQEVVPADECVLASKASFYCGSPDHNAADGCSNPVCFNHDPEPADWIEYTEVVDKVWEEIIGEEAEYARCENCHTDMNRDDGVECGGCGGFFGRHGKGRNGCWTNHNCGVLVTSTGALVKEGDILTYPSHADEFTVMPMQGTWVKGGYARGNRKRGNHEMPIIPRLMYHKETS